MDKQELKNKLSLKFAEKLNLVWNEKTKRWDSNETIDLDNLGLTELPLPFGVIKGSFWCGDNKLTSLENSPTIVGYDFYCNNNKLKNLNGGPTKVYGYYCHDNQLTSLEGAPKEVLYFVCNNNELTSLNGGPTYSNTITLTKPEWMEFLYKFMGNSNK